MTAWILGSRPTFDDAKSTRGNPAFSANDSQDRDTDGGSQDLLRRTIEGEIIPRLMFSCRSKASAPHAATNGAGSVKAREVAEFTDLLLAGDAADISHYVARLLGRGIPRSTVLLDLCAPAERCLGELWESDERDFSEVTLAMGCLQQAVRTMDPFGAGLAADNVSRRTILLTPCANEQHYFGLRLLDMFFMQAGWNVESEFAFDRDRIGGVLKKRHVDILGISISREDLLDQAASDIEMLRRKSSNRSLVVLAGGRVFDGRPKLFKKIGADGTAEDATAAVLLADRLVPLEKGASA